MHPKWSGYAVDLKLQGIIVPLINTYLRTMDQNGVLAELPTFLD
jgi:hypothetical protein